jgi:hypothetical protein
MGGVYEFQDLYQIRVRYPRMKEAVETAPKVQNRMCFARHSIFTFVYTNKVGLRRLVH